MGRDRYVIVAEICNDGNSNYDDESNYNDDYYSRFMARLSQARVLVFFSFVIQRWIVWALIMLLIMVQLCSPDPRNLGMFLGTVDHRSLLWVTPTPARSLT